MTSASSSSGRPSCSTAVLNRPDDDVARGSDAGKSNEHVLEVLVPPLAAGVQASCRQEAVGAGDSGARLVGCGGQHARGNLDSPVQLGRRRLIRRPRRAAL